MRGYQDLIAQSEAELERQLNVRIILKYIKVLSSS